MSDTIFSVKTSPEEEAQVTGLPEDTQWDDTTQSLTGTLQQAETGTLKISLPNSADKASLTFNYKVAVPGDSDKASDFLKTPSMDTLRTFLLDIFDDLTPTRYTDYLTIYQNNASSFLALSTPISPTSPLDAKIAIIHETFVQILKTPNTFIEPMKPFRRVLKQSFKMFLDALNQSV